jgi:phenylacetic acid degradation operon negative regulatory protein
MPGPGTRFAAHGEKGTPVSADSASPRAERTAATDLQPGRLIFSLYGLYARRDPHWIAVSALIRLMADLGVEEPAVRSSVSRLTRRGTLRSLQVGGAAGYALSESSIVLLQEGDVRIFGRRRASLEDGWVLVVFSVPEAERSKRHELRKWLTRLGFGTAASGVWVAPGTLTDETREVLARRGLDTYVDIFRADRVAYGGASEKVSEWWDLAELSAQYEGFISRYGCLAKHHAKRPPAESEAFAQYVTAVTTWRRLPYLDPGLPLALLPRPWNGITASELFTELNDRLAEPAHRHAQRIMKA